MSPMISSGPLQGMRCVRSILIEVPGDPVPWSAPAIGVTRSNNGRRGHRFAKKNPALTNWQKEVAKAARTAYGPYEASQHPVRLDVTFVLRTINPTLHGKIVIPEFKINAAGEVTKKGSLPDRTNLIKAVEDAMEGIVYVNDTQVRHGSDICVWGAEPGVMIAVSIWVHADSHEPSKHG